MSDLDLIAQIDEKIQQLPSKALPEVEDYVSFLLYKYQCPVIKVSKNTPEVTDANMKVAKQQVIQLRSSCTVGDVISPLQELAGSWEGEELQRATQELITNRTGLA